MVGSAQAQTAVAGIELIVPTAGQGSTDVLARIVADGLSRRGFGEVRVRNMPGGSGTLAAAQVAAAPADGGTLLIATPSSHSIASTCEASMACDRVGSFTPIVRFATARAGPGHRIPVLERTVGAGRCWSASAA
jgi:tripartite-type tricarboxylate transporter receptor subunit TctC